MLRLAKPIALVDGRRLTTFSDAATVIVDLPGQELAKPHWELAASLLMVALKKRATEADRRAAETQFNLALESDGLLLLRRCG
jgi:hypothetical protein